MLHVSENILKDSGDEIITYHEVPSGVEGYYDSAGDRDRGDTFGCRLLLMQGRGAETHSPADRHRLVIATAAPSPNETHSPAIESILVVIRAVCRQILLAKEQEKKKKNLPAPPAEFVSSDVIHLAQNPNSAGASI